MYRLFLNDSERRYSHMCFPKYRVRLATGGDLSPECPYPSHLGFFFNNDLIDAILCLDLSKLCRKCCDTLIPGGQYNVWSILASVVPKVNAASLESLLKSAEFYPRILIAGPESNSSAVVLSIPEFSHAKEAWQWIQSEGKPFYIDQLHLTQPVIPSVKRKALIDSVVAMSWGNPFVYTPRPKSSREVSQPLSHPKLKKAVKAAATSGEATEEPGGSNIARIPKTATRERTPKTLLSIDSPAITNPLVTSDYQQRLQQLPVVYPRTALVASPETKVKSNVSKEGVRLKSDVLGEGAKLKSDVLGEEAQGEERRVQRRAQGEERRVQRRAQGEERRVQRRAQGEEQYYQGRA